jgi:hypothetical protein
MGPKSARRKDLSPDEETKCVGFRIHALLPRNNCLYALQLKNPHLTRSSFHRLFQRNDVSRLPNENNNETERESRTSAGNFLKT